MSEKMNGPEGESLEWLFKLFQDISVWWGDFMATIFNILIFLNLGNICWPVWILFWKSRVFYTVYTAKRSNLNLIWILKYNTSCCGVFISRICLSTNCTFLTLVTNSFLHVFVRCPDTYHDSSLIDYNWQPHLSIYFTELLSKGLGNPLHGNSYALVCECVCVNVRPL